MMFLLILTMQSSIAWVSKHPLPVNSPEVTTSTRLFYSKEISIELEAFVFIILYTNVNCSLQNYKFNNEWASTQFLIPVFYYNLI